VNGQTVAWKRLILWPLGWQCRAVQCQQEREEEASPVQGFTGSRKTHGREYIAGVALLPIRAGEAFDGIPGEG
jgi:hypothetical protein